MHIVRASDCEFEAASHEDPKNPGVLKKVLAGRDDFLDGRVQMLNWALLPKGSRFQAHYHEDMAEAFLLLGGPVGVRVGDEESELQRGDLLIVPPKAIHEMWNKSEGDLEYIVFGVSLGQGGKTVIVE